jgi:hypothetical protein
MTRIRITMMALLAVFCLGAIAAATASAAAPELINSKGEEFKGKFTGEGGSGTLETVGGNEIKCSKTSATGEVTKAKGGETTITFTGCEALKGFAKCNSKPKKASGEIVTKLSFLLVLEFTSSGELEPAIYLTILPAKSTVELECTALQTLLVRGGLLALLGPEGKKGKTLTLEAKQSKGKQATTEYRESATGTRKLVEGLETEGKGAKTFGFEQSGEAATATLTFPEEVELIG